MQKTQEDEVEIQNGQKAKLKKALISDFDTQTMIANELFISYNKTTYLFIKHRG